MVFSTYGNFYIGLTLGFIATMAIAVALNRLGDAMFRRGVARPFFVLGHRLHHRSFLYRAVPFAYFVVSVLLLAGYVHIVWSVLWTGLAGTSLVAADCLIMDMAMDYALKGRGKWLLKHELVYAAVPLYAFSMFLR
ncbi:MAG: hypothetical protein JRM85_01530 [Nitrososphaerota archaeon]|nr:hypothetical protein [Nitrososphaerota archaeon]MDG6946701.1 hypothetical protein [Nitrososphaerota archaeon]